MPPFENPFKLDTVSPSIMEQTAAGPAFGRTGLAPVV